MKNHQSLIFNHKSIPPKQYIKGYVEFYKLRFKVTPDVLIPRPETELLVDEVLKFYALNPIPYTLIDLGTGSGNIATSIAKNLPACPSGRQGLNLHLEGANVNIIATDISSKALKVAKQNAKLHGVENKITFIQSNLLNAFCHSEVDTSTEEYKSNYILRFTQNDNIIIVTNLPYIPSSRIPYLDSSVKDFEPHVALDGGEDGFGLYRKLFHQITHLGGGLCGHLGKIKLIIGEIDYTHGELAINEALKYFPNAEVEVKTDLSHKQRILKISL